MKVCDVEYCSELIDDDESVCVRCEKAVFDADMEMLEEHGVIQ